MVAVSVHSFVDCSLIVLKKQESWQFYSFLGRWTSYVASSLLLSHAAARGEGEVQGYCTLDLDLCLGMKLVVAVKGFI
jgi:hypothetical protein